MSFLPTCEFYDFNFNDETTYPPLTEKSPFPVKDAPRSKKVFFDEYYSKGGLIVTEVASSSSCISFYYPKTWMLVHGIEKIYHSKYWCYAEEYRKSLILVTPETISDYKTCNHIWKKLYDDLQKGKEDE